MFPVESIPRGKAVFKKDILWGIGTGRSQNEKIALRRAIVQAAEAMSRHVAISLRNVTLYGYNYEKSSQSGQLDVCVVLKMPFSPFMYEKT